MLTFITLIIFGSWIALTLINQFDIELLNKRLFRYDRWLLIPKWTFFAPVPGSSDYRIAYRRFDSEDDKGPWREILTTRKRIVLDALWNPDKHVVKGIFDLAQTCLTIRRASDDPNVIPTSAPYILILKFVESRSRSVPGTFVEFTVIESTPEQDRNRLGILIKSAVHCVDT